MLSTDAFTRAAKVLGCFTEQKILGKFGVFLTPLSKCLEEKLSGFV